MVGPTPSTAFHSNTAADCIYVCVQHSAALPAAPRAAPVGAEAVAADFSISHEGLAAVFASRQ